jgi:PAS domain S-box-containing protein
MPANKLRETEAKLNALLHYAGDAIFLMNQDRVIGEVNQSACDLLGYSTAELVGRKMHDLVPSQEIDKFDERTIVINESGGSVHERIFQRKDGSLVDTEVNVRSIAGMGYISIVRDITSRKVAEEKRIQSEQRYKSIIAVSNTGAWEYHSDRKFQWCSPEFFMMLGRSVQDYNMSGNSNLKEVWVDLLHPADRQRAVDQFSEYLNSGSIGTYESYFRMLHSNGEWVWIWSRGLTLRDSAGNVTTVTVGTHINITERKKTDERLKERDSQLTSILENVASSLGLIDANKKIVFFNSKFAQNYRFITKQEPRIGQGVYDAFTDAMKEVPEQLLENALKGKKEIFENDYVRDGKVARLRSYYIPVVNGGKVTGVITSSIDLTTNRENEIKLVQSEEKFRLAFMTSRDAFYIGTMKDGRILDVNQSFTTVFGYTREEAIGKTVFELNIYDDPEERTRVLKEIKEGGVLKDIELTCRKKSGALMSTSISANTMEMNGEQCILAVIRDVTRRKRAEQQLMESEIRFREVLENSVSASYKRNLVTNTYDYLSPVFNKIAGYMQEEMNAMPLDTVIGLMHPDDVQEVNAGIIKALQSDNGSAQSFEYRFRHKSDGQYRWLRDEFVVRRNPEGAAVAFIGSVSDITVQKAIEQDLITSKEQLRLFIEHSPASLAMFDTEMRYIATSRRWMTDYHLSNQSVIGLTHYEVFPEIAQTWKDVHQRCLNGAVEKKEEEAFTRADGKTDWLKWEVRPWHNALGGIGGIIMFTEVITAQKESELRFRNLVEESPFGVYIIQNRRFVYVNSKFEKIIGYTREELFEMKDTMQIVCEEELPYAEEQYRRRVEDGAKNIHMELKYRRKDGKEVWGSVHSTTTLYNGSEAVIGSLQDISERKLMELEQKKTMEELVDRNTTLEQFSYIVSHNLRSPVSTIVGMSEAVLALQLQPADKEQMLQGIRSSARKLDTVIKDLTTILTVRRNANEQREPVRFSELLNDVQQSLSENVKKENVKFITDFAAIDEMSTVKSYLYSVFYNLVSNSIKYRRSDVDPVIEIGSEINKDSVILYFRDNGLGINLQNKKKEIFGLYKRFHAHVEGKGVGLFMVKTQLESIGGKISVESEENSGTEFRIEFARS